MFTADKIDDQGVWLGDVKASENQLALNQHKITAILSIVDYQPLFNDKNKVYLHIYADDLTSTDLITNEFDKAYEFIETSIKDGRQVLVHCHAGRSRSVTIVAMYLMRKYSLTTEESIEKIRSRRRYNEVKPNDGFLKQLDLFYRMNYKIDRESSIYNEYQRNRFVTTTNVDNSNSFLLINDTENHSYRCLNCSEILFKSNDIQLHQNKSNIICRNSTVIFTYFLDWTDEIFVEPVGSINCRNCKAILGEYSLEGLRCLCDQWIRPAFGFQCQSIK